MQVLEGKVLNQMYEVIYSSLLCAPRLANFILFIFYFYFYFLFFDFDFYFFIVFIVFIYFYFYSFFKKERVFPLQNDFRKIFCGCFGIGFFASSDTCKGKAAYIQISPDPV